MSSWPWDWAKPMGSLMKDGSISTTGLIAVYAIIIIFSLLNYWSVKLLTSFYKFNFILQTWSSIINNYYVNDLWL